MKQINEDTQTARPIQRRVCGSKFPDTDVVLTNNRKSEPEAADGRSQLLHDNSKMAAKFIESLFHVIYQVYSSSAGPQVRHRSFRVLLRMTHFADASLLESVLRSQEISAQLAGMLSSADYKSVVGAMQMAFILMEKLPGIFAAAHAAGEDDLSLTHLGRSYTVDLAIMKQINEDTQTARPIQRRVCGSKFPDTDVVLTNNRKSEPEAADGRSQLLHDNSKMAAKFIESLFHVIYQVYSSSAGPQVRHRSFRVLLRMTHFADASLLESVLRSQEISAQLAGMLSSADYKSVVGAMQMAFILMEKLPGIFAVFFKREGVMHQISELAGSQKLPLMRNFRGQKVASAPDLT
ncbi:unnamed protein product, partial [Cyprideis torosa]